MATIIPQDWFMGDEHEMSRIAWFLYRNEDRFQPDILEELVEQLKQFEEDKFIEVGNFEPRLANIEKRSVADQKLWVKAQKNVLAKAQKREKERRRIAKAKAQKQREENPILALTDPEPEEKPISNSLYDYYTVPNVEFTVDAEFQKLKRIAEAKKQEASKEEPPKKKKAQKKSKKL